MSTRNGLLLNLEVSGIWSNYSRYSILLFFFSEPSASPPNLRLVDTTSTSILVEWNEVPSVDRNGIILSYTIKYQAVGDDEVTVEGPVNTTTVDFPTLRANLSGLIKNQRYNISVLATTIKGNGPYSDPITEITNQDSKSVFSP